MEIAFFDGNYRFSIPYDREAHIHRGSDVLK